MCNHAKLSVTQRHPAYRRKLTLVPVRPTIATRVTVRNNMWGLLSLDRVLRHQVVWFPKLTGLQ